MLKDKLAAMRAASAEQVPPETLATMLKAREDLAHSGILDRVIKVGASLPGFTLDDADGRPLALADLLDDGPLLISLYRGVW